MGNSHFYAERYLDRIGLAKAPGANKAGLVALHHAQFFNIPFENFDIQMGKSINLDEKYLFDKLVCCNRGGYCFDLEYVTDGDIKVGNYYTSHSPDTHFTQIRTASKPTENGRISLRNFTFTEIKDNQIFTQEIEDSPAYLEFLKQKFEIELDIDYKQLRKV
jgi:arylamine N-acetyltransferase